MSYNISQFMKVIYFIVLIQSISIFARDTSIDDRLSTDEIVKRAVKFLSQKDCRGAITYLSSPKLKEVKNYDSFKYYEAQCYYFLKDYAKSQLVIGLVNKENLSNSLKVK